MLTSASNFPIPETGELRTSIPVSSGGVRASTHLAGLRFFFPLAVSVVLFAAPGQFAFGADGATTVSTPPAFGNWFAHLAAFVGTVRLFSKFIQAPLQNFLTAAVARVNASAEKDDDQLLHNLFGALWYRALAFLFDYLLSLKLPTSDSLLTHREENPQP